MPGVTVNRYCSSSLQTIRMAAHAIKAGEGDVFVAGGVETVSRFMHGMADDGPLNERFAEARARTKRRAEGGQPAWTPPTGLPDVYIAMGQTAENVAEAEGVTREEMDEWGLRSQERAVAAQENGVLRPRDHPGHARGRHGREPRRRAAARHHAREARAAQAGVPARRQGDRRATPAPSTTARPPSS
ncbi:MAG: hypothetical protein KatS3mg009_2722 [Acidimicrobiia bacterium]|nr:MAG: hypothetical protein KatS3mg009_2722 [Acidimicrobiia bacterium]